MLEPRDEFIVRVVHVLVTLRALRDIIDDEHDDVEEQLVEEPSQLLPLQSLPHERPDCEEDEIESAEVDRDEGVLLVVVVVRPDWRLAAAGSASAPIFAFVPRWALRCC